MKHTNRETKWLLALLMVGATLRLALFIAIYPDETKAFTNDSFGYDRLAVNLVRYHLLSPSSASPFEPEAFRTPVYPLFLTLVYSLFGHKPFVAIFFQTLLSVIALYIIYRFGKALFNGIVGVIAAGFLALDLSNIFFTSQLLTETLFALLLLFSIYQLALFLQREKTRYGVLAGIFLGAATLCRPVALYSPIFLIVAFLVQYKANVSLGLKRFTIVVICFLLVIVPWVIRNHYFFGVPQLTAIQGYNLLFWNTPYLRSRLEGITWLEAQREIRREVENELERQVLNPLEAATYYQDKAVKEILQHPYDYAVVHFGGILSLLFNSNVRLALGPFGMAGEETGAFAALRAGGMAGAFKAFRELAERFPKLARSEQLVLTLVLLDIGILVMIYLAALYSLWLNMRDGNWIAIVSLGTAVIYLALVAGPIGDVRFRMPMMPFIYLSAAHGLSKLLLDKFHDAIKPSDA